MSCMLTAPEGCDPCLPIGPDEMDELRRLGLTALTGLIGDPAGLKPRAQQYIGVAQRTDGVPFYLTVLAPSCEDATDTEEWSGAFYAPYGFCTLTGRVSGRAASKEKYLIEVEASLESEGRAMLGARWVIAGPHPKIRAANRAALMQSIEISDSGPHDADTIRACIALHAPAAAWGEPRAVVTQQCGVAAACLIEAVC